MGYKTYTCPHARKCGGCELLAVPYELQLKRKQRAMEELFADVIDQDGATLESIRGMEKPLAYRYKAASPYAPGKRMRCGFYERGTHRLVYCKQCLVEPRGVRQILHDVAQAVVAVTRDLTGIVGGLLLGAEDELLQLGQQRTVHLGGGDVGSPRCRNVPDHRAELTG